METAQAPANPYSDTWEKMTRVGVYLAEAADTAPTEADLRPDIICNSIVQRAGSQLHQATFTVDLGKQGRNIEKRQLTANASRQIEVWTLKEQVELPGDSLRDQCLFWGELTTDRIAINKGQAEQWTAVVAEHLHFGEAIIGQVTYDPVADDLDTVHVELEFNPQIDGEIENNMLAKDAEKNSAEHPIWVDPEAMRTVDAIEYFNGAADGDEPQPWTVKDIVNAICLWRNENEDYVDNPSDSHVENVISDAPEVRDLILTTGGYLPEYLSAILPQYGFNWCLRTNADGSASKRSIFIYQRGTGTSKQVKLQKFGADISKQDEVDQLSVEYDFNDVRNRIRVQGGLIQREVTLPLYPAWPEAEDGTEQSTILSNIVGRKWIANEGGSYTDVRTEISTPPLLDFLGPPRNRVPEDCLTLRGGARMPVLVEYSTNGGTTWKDISAIAPSFRVMTTECGIYFTRVSSGTDVFNATIMDLSGTSLRMTCTLTGDYRLEHRTAKSSDSPVSLQAERIIRAHTQFVDRQRQSTGGFASDLTGDHESRDDTTEIQEFADRLLEDATRADISASIRLFGLNFEYKIGDIIQKVDGRSISFNRLADSVADGAYLQVVGISYQLGDRQYTTLEINAYDVEGD